MPQKTPSPHLGAEPPAVAVLCIPADPLQTLWLSVHGLLTPSCLHVAVRLEDAKDASSPPCPPEGAHKEEVTEMYNHEAEILPEDAFAQDDASAKSSEKKN